MSAKPTLQIISTLFILIPIFLNGLRLRKSGTLGRIFFCFLLAGLIADISMGYMHFNEIEGVSIYIFSAYSLGEALFFFWLIRYLGPTEILKKVAGFFLVVTPFVWIAVQIPFYEAGKTARNIPFDTSYEVAAAFLAGFALLSMAEQEGKLATSAEFWLILGVFFYCFCTFFLMTFLGSQLSLNLWPLNNIINILTYLFYSLGWWMYRKE